jgi:hypothetical protein
MFELSYMDLPDGGHHFQNFVMWDYSFVVVAQHNMLGLSGLNYLLQGI